MHRSLVVSVVAVAGFASASSAQFFDGFESYAPGTLMQNVGGWFGWGNSAGAAGLISTAQAHSGANSISTANPGNADAVHPFTGITSGLQTLTAWQYIPSNSFTADTYFIVMNAYTHTGGWTWSIEMQFDITTGNVLDDFRPETNTIPIALDQWSEIRIEFDLDNDAQTTFYNGVELSTGTMTRSAGDPLAIANIDLFSTGGEAFYDDISIVPAPGAMGLLAVSAGLFLRRRRA